MMRTEVIAPSPASGIQSAAGSPLRRSVLGEDDTDEADGKAFGKDRRDFRDARKGAYISPFRHRTQDHMTNRGWRQIGGSVRVLPGLLCHSAWW
jgi:hypothetical protein